MHAHLRTAAPQFLCQICNMYQYVLSKFQVLIWTTKRWWWWWHVWSSCTKAHTSKVPIYQLHYNTWPKLHSSLSLRKTRPRRYLPRKKHGAASHAYIFTVHCICIYIILYYIILYYNMGSGKNGASWDPETRAATFFLHYHSSLTCVATWCKIVLLPIMTRIHSRISMHVRLIFVKKLTYQIKCCRNVKESRFYTWPLNTS